jgi:alkylation response protein AidB-like acyl-CoA dehydrogenase
VTIPGAEPRSPDSPPQPPAAPGEAQVRADLRAWLAANWDPELGLAQWRARLADSGWGFPAWPAQWHGRSLPAGLAHLVAGELAAALVPGPPEGIGPALAAPVILEHGSDDLRRAMIRPIAAGEVTWCQLFSEPGAGSDLAGLAARAERDGDEWRITGQKVWNTGAATADYGLLLARTDPGVPKHRGLTCFVLPMRQPGVTVRPLRQMNGHASFNEVFLDEAVVPAGHVIGAPGDGWRMALAVLAHERRLATRAGSAPPGAVGRAWREAVAERTAAAEPHKWYPQRAGRPDLVIERARAAGRSGDPVVRQEIARLFTLTETARWTAARAAAARAAGRPPGPEGSLGKLASSAIARQSARVHSLISGAAGLLTGPQSELGGTVAEIYVSVPAVSIAGGTDEIQHTIIGERILGLPKEPDVSRHVPFRDIPRGG